MRLARFFSLAAAAALTVSCSAEVAEPPPPAETGALPEGTQLVNFKVEGMGCEACPPQVRQKVAALEGIDVADVDVDLEAGTCSIRWQEGDPSVEAIEKSVEGSQFTLLATN